MQIAKVLLFSLIISIPPSFVIGELFSGLFAFIGAGFLPVETEGYRIVSQSIISFFFILAVFLVVLYFALPPSRKWISIIPLITIIVLVLSVPAWYLVVLAQHSDDPAAGIGFLLLFLVAFSLAILGIYTALLSLALRNALYRKKKRMPAVIATIVLMLFPLSLMLLE